HDDRRGLSPWVNEFATAPPDDWTFVLGRRVRFFSARGAATTGLGGNPFGCGRAGIGTAVAIGLTACGRAVGLRGFGCLTFAPAIVFGEVFFAEGFGRGRRAAAFLTAPFFAAALFFACTFAMTYLAPGDEK